MRKLKNWLLPRLFLLFTALIVLACTLLPRQLSRLQDKKLFHILHPETISADISLPVWSPELTQKLPLLTLWHNKSEDLTIIHREVNETESTPEELSAMLELIYAELDYFKQKKLLPEDVFSSGELAINGWRIYLRENTASAGNWFLQVELYDGYYESGLWLILDEETGRTLEMTFYNYGRFLYPSSITETGAIFLDHLDVEYELAECFDERASFDLKESKLRYFIQMQSDFLSIAPELLEAGMEASPYDANFPEAVYDANSSKKQ